MASKKIQAAIKGSIANPEAAQAVLAAIDASGEAADITQLEEDVSELQDEILLKANTADLGALATANAAADVADIADPNTADAEACATKINELLVSLRAAGILA